MVESPCSTFSPVKSVKQVLIVIGTRLLNSAKGCFTSQTGLRVSFQLFFAQFSNCTKVMSIYQSFSVDLKCGFLQIILSEEDCFAAVINSKGTRDKKCEKKISIFFGHIVTRPNYGKIMIGCLFWKDAGFDDILPREKNQRLNLGRLMLTILLYKVSLVQY